MESEDEINHDWQQIERKAMKVGLREGLSNGRDSNFQNSFNEGFIQGFKNGFAVGQYKGALFIKNRESGEDNESEDLLKHPHRGWCQVCEHTDTTNSTIKNIIEEQIRISRMNLNTLHSKYGAELQLPLDLF